MKQAMLTCDNYKFIPSVAEIQYCNKKSGTHLGMPYVGCKRKIAYDIVTEIRKRHRSAKYFVDLFGGGGAISLMALQFEFNVLYNELNKGTYNLFNFLCTNPFPAEWLEWIDRDKFEYVCNNDFKDPKATMVRICYSFNGIGDGYLYSKDFEKYKRSIHEVIMNRDSNALQYVNDFLKCKIQMPNATNWYGRYLQLRQCIDSAVHKHYLIYKNPNLKLKKQDGKVLGLKNNLKSVSLYIDMANLTKLRNLESTSDFTRRMNHNKIVAFSNKDYRDVDLSQFNPAETVVYCDPPYANTLKSHQKNSIYNGNFNSDELAKWAKSTTFPVYISEYTNIGNFEIVWQKEKVCLLGGANNKSRNYNQELLLWNGKNGK